MKIMLITLFAVLLLPMHSVLAKTQTVDCPLRDQPYSIDSPLMDILLNPNARAAVDSVNSNLLSKVPAQLIGAQAPSLSAIMTMRKALGFGGAPESELTAINEALKKVSLTEADKEVRCARYDVEIPKFEQAKGKPRILLFEKINGFRDAPSIAAAKAMITDMATRLGWSLVVTDKGGAINPKTLQRFDVVIWNNVSGDVLTLSQRKAFEDYMANGGGFVGIHGSGGDFVYYWDWYADTLIGARFLGHPMDPQFQDARVNIESSLSGIGRDLAPGWTMMEEWYSFKASPRATGAHIIATLDETTYKPVGMYKQKLRMGDDHPIVWTRCVNNGRAFYSAIGHRTESYTEPNHIKLVEQAVIWAAGSGESQCVKGQEEKIAISH